MTAKAFICVMPILSVCYVSILNWPLLLSPSVFKVVNGIHALGRKVSLYKHTTFMMTVLHYSHNFSQHLVCF